MNYLELYKDKLIEIYYDNELDGLLVGYIRVEDEKYIAIETFDPMGLQSGYLIVLKENINIIKIDTEYLKDLEILIKENSKENIRNSYIYKGSELEIDNKNVFMNTLKEIMNKKVICKIILSNSEHSVYGFVERIIDDNQILISYFKEKTLINISDIKNIYIDAISHRENYILDKIKFHNLK
ncbi:hypothetical protein [Oceanivirga salmonicida]|uniref:hypothetical protein n=1 Tax=Oceanivirga salmonicida TaxID=1769291 RepID=UPI00082DA07B|nr:hypothetical protein [Oceanivirga salmonicida]